MAVHVQNSSLDDATEQLVRKQGDVGSSITSPAAVVASGRAPRPRSRRGTAAGRACIFVCASLVALTALRSGNSSVRGQKGHGKKDSVPVAAQATELDGHDIGPVEDFDGSGPPAGAMPPAFLALDEKDGYYCGQEGDMCKCFGHVRYGRLFTWSDDIVVDGSVNCSAATFGDPVPMNVKICKCYPTICTTDVGICTPEPCSCPTSRDPSVEWAKKTLMTGDGTKCWACEKRQSVAGIAVDEDSPYCPTTIGRCSKKRSCKCESASDTKRVMRTKDGEKCWTCAASGEGGAFRMDSGQKAMFWMLPLLWSFMDFPDSAWEVMSGCRALTSVCVLMIVGFLCQSFAQFLRLDGYLSFYAPCMKKGEFWRLFTYFVLHSDLQHLCVNLFHLLDALDLEGVPPGLEVSPGVPLKCARDGPMAQICYPDVGIGFNHVIAIFSVVLAYGALIGTIRNFTAIVQGASSLCFGVDGALIALYGVFLGAGLDQQLKIPEFGAFFWMRIGIIALHIVIDIMQSVCSGGKDTVGTMAHMASLVAGFCYVILVLPPMGDGTFFSSEVPYIVDCGLTSASYVTMEDATSQCLAFFKRSNGLRVETAKQIAVTILAGGVLLSAVNAFRNRHESADGIACCSDSTPQRPQDVASRGASAGQTGEDGPGRSFAEEISTVTKARDNLRAHIEQLQKVHLSMPNIAPPAGAGAVGGAQLAPA